MSVGFGKEWVMTSAGSDDDTVIASAGIQDDDTVISSVEIYECDDADILGQGDNRSEYRSARDKALWLLSRQDYSVKCMREKLLSKGFSSEDIEKVIIYLKKLSYLDDERFARSYVRTHSGISRQSLKQKLYNKGIDGELSNIAMEECYTGDPSMLISKLADKKHFDPASADYESTCKFKSYLYLKGFDSSEIREYFSQH